MMEKTKKERQEKQFRQSLKTLAELQPNLLTLPQSESNNSLLAKVYPQIAELNSLRILTILQITYLLQVYIELLEKVNADLIGEFKIGIIGGGITGRLILNSLLPFSKDGLNLKNVTVSTRQVDNFKIYVQNFGVRCHFDNEITAKESDFLIIATPATLDNWVIADLKVPIAQRILLSQKKSQVSISGSSYGTKQVSQISKSNAGKVESKMSKKEENQRYFPFKPLVYLLTSDFNEQKCNKMFNFPVFTPSIRQKDIPVIKQTLELFKSKQSDSFQSHQKIYAWWLLRQKQEDKDRIQSADSQTLKEAASFKNQLIQKYSKVMLNNLLSILSFVTTTTSSTASIASSISNTISVSDNMRDTKRRQQSLAQVIEVLTVHGEVDETLFKKLRKWTMAHNNFIS